MQIYIVAERYKDMKGYQGAILELPASPYEIEDALLRAHVPERGEYVLEGSNGWPEFLWDSLWESRTLFGEKSLGELNVLALAISRMSEIQLETYEGAIRLHMDEKGQSLVALKEMINIAFCLESYKFYPGVVSDCELGALYLKRGMLNVMDGPSDESVELLDPVKVGKKLQNIESGVLTSKGFVFRCSPVGQEFYDGEHLPDYMDSHCGLLSLRIKKMGDFDTISGVWLELPASSESLSHALESIGEETFDSCYIAETRSIVPAFRFMFGAYEDIRELNVLAGRLKDLSDDGEIMKYRAALELEQCSELGVALDIAVNLNCYDYDPEIVFPETYGECLLQNAGIDTSNPAFSDFNFSEYGERELAKGGFVFTPYGVISRKGQEFVYENMEQEAEEMGQELVQEPSQSFGMQIGGNG